MTGAQQVELYWLVGLLAGVVLTAAIVNRFRPASRPRLRRLVTVFVLYGLSTGLGIGFGAVDMPTWSGSLLATAELLRAFTIVSLAGTILFAVMLPSIGLNLPMIASDLIVGVGYVVTTLAVLSRHGLDPTQRARVGRGGQRRARDLAAEHARQHPRRRRAAARRLDPRRRLDPARERQAGQGARRFAGATPSSRRATGRRSSCRTRSSSRTDIIDPRQARRRPRFRSACGSTSTSTSGTRRVAS